LIYFDNAATTKISPSVLEKVIYMLENNFANPSSLHKLGFNAEMEIKKSKKIISSCLNVLPEEIIFTSGGTEANNMAVIGTARAYKRAGNNIITVNTEHSSVTECFKMLEQNGFNVTYIDVDKKGYVDIDMLSRNINDKTILVSIMHINNEIGTVQDIEKIGKIIKEKNTKTLFHVDAVQSFGKYKIDIKNIDLLSLSGHKIHSPKGIGALYIKKGVKIKPIIIGGGQQGGLRSGTENVSGICGLSTAAENACKNMYENFDKVSAVKNKLLEITDLIEDVSVNGDAENGSPYILNLSFKDIKAEVLLHALEDKNIFVSTGSACSSKQKKHKKVMDYIDSYKAESAIRFSFCENNTVEEAQQCIDELIKIVPVLRKYKSR